MLLLFLLLPLTAVQSSDLPKQTRFELKDVPECPKVGYFFKREVANALPGVCYLCFCRGEKNALCWPRENKRCDIEAYTHKGVKKRESRLRRSLGIAVTSLTALINNAISGETTSTTVATQECKPNDESYSEGCPPDDWCAGCKACDCGADGRWNCQILSFCGENEKPKAFKGRILKRRIYKMRGVTTANQQKNNRTNTKSPVSRTNQRKSNSKSKNKLQRSKYTTTTMSAVDRIKKKESTRLKSKQKNKYHPAATKSGRTPTASTTTTKSRTISIPPIRKSKMPKPKRRQNSLEKRSTTAHTKLKENNKEKTKKPVQKKTTKKPSKKKSSKKIAKKNSDTDKKHKKTILKSKVSKEKAVHKTLHKKGVTMKLSNHSLGNTGNMISTVHATENMVQDETTKSGIAVTTNGSATEILNVEYIFNVITNSTEGNTTDLLVTLKELGLLITETEKPITTVPNSLDEQMYSVDATDMKRVAKRSMVKKIYVGKSKSNSTVNRSKISVKDVPTKAHKTKIKVEKSNKVKLNKRHKRSYENWNQTTEKPLNTTSPTTPQVVQRMVIENEIFNTNVSNAYYKYTINNSRLATEHVTDITHIIPVSHGTIMTNRALEVEPITESSNLTVLKLNNTSVLPVTIMLPKNYTINPMWWSNTIDNQNEIIPTSENATSPLNVIETSTVKYISANMLLSALNLTSNSSEIKKCRYPKKYKMKKIVSTLLSKSIKDLDANETNPDSIIRKAKLSSKLDTFKNFVHKFLVGFGKSNNTKTHSLKKSKLKLVKYLKKFFKNLFSKINHKERRNKTNVPQLSQTSVIETLCETFGPCNIDTNNKARLQRNIHALNIETYKMLKSIKIIKGLLRTLDFAKGEKGNSSDTSTAFKHDIRKLHSILRGTYGTEEKNKNLTSKQTLELDRVKNSTQHFIKSATRFAIILNDIVNRLTSFEINTSTVIDNRVVKNITQNHPIVARKSSKINLGSYLIRPSRGIEVNETVTNTVKPKEEEHNNKTHSDPIQRIKTLIAKFNDLQKTFMKKVYKLISSYDDVNLTDSNQNVSAEMKNTNQTNRTVAIRTYTKNIIRNLRKLKDMAQKLTSHSRRKRDVDEADSLEYLLMLMEFLLRQSNPLHAPPVNDGIDLIIDAIKQAPDINKIKPIVKKVLTTASRTTTSTTKSSKIQTIADGKSSENTSDMKITSEDADDDGDGMMESNEPLYQKYEPAISANEEELTDTNNQNQLTLIEDKFKDSKRRFNLHIPLDETDDDDVFKRRIKNEASTTEVDYYIKEEQQKIPLIEALVEGTTKSVNIFTPAVVLAASGEITQQADFDKEVNKKVVNVDVFDSEPEEDIVSSSFNSILDAVTEINNELTVGPVQFASIATVSTEPLIRRSFRENKRTDMTEKQATETEKQVTETEKYDSVEVIESTQKLVIENQTEVTKKQLMEAEKNDSVKVINSTIMPITKLDWIGADSSEDNKDENNSSETEKAENSNNVTVDANNSEVFKKIKSTNISNISKDIDEAKRRRLRADDLAYKKEMDLLNSLDYGTDYDDKSDKDTSDSKIDSKEDKYSPDAFDNYAL